MLPPRTGAPAGGQGAQLLAADVSPCDATAGTTGDNDRRRPEPGSLEFAVAARYVKPGVGRPHTRVWRWGRTVRGDVRERVDAQRGVFRAGGRRGGGLCRMRRHFYPTHFLFFLLFKKKKLPFFTARCQGSVKTNKNCAVRWKNAERCEKRCAYEVPRRKKGARVSLQPYTALALKVGAFRLREEATPERQSAEQCPVAATPRISETGAPEEEGPGGLQVTDPEEIRRSSRRETRRGSASRRLSFLSGHAGSAVGRTVPPAGAGPAASLALTPP